MGQDNMSDDPGTSEDDGDYAYGESHLVDSKRYPVHDCCELDDIDALRVSAMVRRFSGCGRAAGGSGAAARFISCITVRLPPVSLWMRSQNLVLFFSFKRNYYLFQ